MICLGLIGYPLTHSLSPKIHNAAMKYCELEGQYSLYPIFPDEQQKLKIILEQVREGIIIGLNVTIPHKQNVMNYLDELTPVAKAIGAVNTIYLSSGKLTGDNTDAPGFLADLHRHLKDDHNREGLIKKALILGAGGAARAVTYALANDGWNVVISARRTEQAEDLISQFLKYSYYLKRIDFDGDNFRSNLSKLSLIINTTPVGMSPDLDKSPLPEGVPFPSSLRFYDLVYNSRETKFIQNARSVGLQAWNGLGMLVEQAALSFKIWTGFEVPRKILLDALEEK